METLVAAARFDVCGYNGHDLAAPSPLRFVHRAALPGGGCVSLFKVLLTNVCVNDCAYCVNQVSLDCHRASFQPEELARLFVELHRKRLVQGLFLSSGIAGNASRTMESMVKTVEVLRHRHDFEGYIHLKILPGASFDCVEAGCRLASRVSVNMEAPTAHHLAKLSSRKDISRGILEPMRWVKQLMAGDDRLVPAGQTTQFVVGAAGEADRDILHTTAALYSDLGLRRVYFSAFSPVTGSRLESLPAAPPLRQHRLYQADWLLRVYGFQAGEVELALGNNGNLPLHADPKQVIAGRQPWLFPVDVNRAGYDELVRVPGIGPVSAARILQARRQHSITSLDDLGRMRVATKRAAPFIWFQGMRMQPRQTSFLGELVEEEARRQPALAQVVT